MSGLNLSEWALRHRSFVVFLMIVVTAAGLSLVLQARPQRGSGLHLQDHGRAGCLARRHARRHAEAGDRAARAQAAGDAGPRFPAQLHDAGRDDRSSSTSRAATPAAEVPDIWYQVRKNIGDIRHTLPAGVVGPGFNDEFGDTFGIIYGFTRRRLHPSRAARLRRGRCARDCCTCPTSRRSRSSARRTSASSSSSPPSSWPGWASTAPR